FFETASFVFLKASLSKWAPPLSNLNQPCQYPTPATAMTITTNAMITVFIGASSAKPDAAQEISGACRARQPRMGNRCPDYRLPKEIWKFSHVIWGRGHGFNPSRLPLKVVRSDAADIGPEVLLLSPLQEPPHFDLFVRVRVVAAAQEAPAVRP